MRDRHRFPSVFPYLRIAILSSTEQGKSSLSRRQSLAGSATGHRSSSLLPTSEYGVAITMPRRHARQGKNHITYGNVSVLGRVGNYVNATRENMEIQGLI
jgi:hypothetical protein